MQLWTTWGSGSLELCLDIDNCGTVVGLSLVSNIHRTQVKGHVMPLQSVMLETFLTDAHNVGYSFLMPYCLWPCNLSLFRFCSDWSFRVSQGLQRCIQASNIIIVFTVRQRTRCRLCLKDVRSFWIHGDRRTGGPYWKCWLHAVILEYLACCFILWTPLYRFNITVTMFSFHVVLSLNSFSLKDWSDTNHKNNNCSYRVVPCLMYDYLISRLERYKTITPLTALLRWRILPPNKEAVKERAIPPNRCSLSVSVCVPPSLSLCTCADVHVTLHHTTRVVKTRTREFDSTGPQLEE